MNWSKTYQYFKEAQAEHLYKKPSDQKQEDNFRELVTNPATGQPNGEITRVVHQIYRVRDKNGKEWLQTFEMRSGYDTYKSPTPPQAFRDVGIHLKPIFSFPLVPNLEKKTLEKKVEGPTGFEIIHDEDMAFTKKKAQELYALRDRRNIVLAIIEEDSGKNPIQIESFDDFIDRSFDELQASAEKTKAVQTENQAVKQIAELLAKALTQGNATPEVKKTAERVLEEQAPVNV